MCRILEVILRNYEQNFHRSEESQYNRRSLVDLIEAENTASFEKRVEADSSPFYPTEDIPERKYCTVHAYLHVNLCILNVVSIELIEESLQQLE